MSVSEGLADDEPDYTMLSRRWSRVELITAETALEIARRVYAHESGAVDLAANEPLGIEDRGRHWVITGSKRNPQRLDTSLDISRTEDFPFAMKISKFDAQILSYSLMLPTK